MEFKKEIETLLKSLKERGHDRGRIEKKLGYATNSIDQSLTRGGSIKLLRGIQLYNEWVLSNSIALVSNSLVQDRPRDPDLERISRDLAEVLATVQRIENRISVEHPSETDKRIASVREAIRRKDKVAGKGK